MTYINLSCFYAECHNSCNAGLRRCTGFGAHSCCLTFSPDLECRNESNCTSLGPNYVANIGNGFVCCKCMF